MTIQLAQQSLGTLEEPCLWIGSDFFDFKGPKTMQQCNNASDIVVQPTLQWLLEDEAKLDQGSRTSQVSGS